MLAFDPATGKTTTLYAGSTQDRYHNPGRAMTVENANGKMVLKLTPDGQGIYFLSPGASPGGDQPFVAIMPGRRRRGKDSVPFPPIRTSSSPRALVSNSTVADPPVRSQTMSPNYFTASLSGGEPMQVTHFKGRYDGIKMPTRQFLKYKRADGVDLTATLWLPAGYDKSQGPLPDSDGGVSGRVRLARHGQPGERLAEPVSGLRRAGRTCTWCRTATRFWTARRFRSSARTAKEPKRYLCGSARRRSQRPRWITARRWASSIPGRVAVMGTQLWGVHDRESAGAYRYVPCRHCGERRVQPLAYAVRLPE